MKAALICALIIAALRALTLQRHVGYRLYGDYLYHFWPQSVALSAATPTALARWLSLWATALVGRISHFTSNWILSTNHRRIAVMYFIFTVITGFSGLVLATVIRVELAYAGQGILCGNAEKYLTIVSLHGVIMVFFVVIPILFGAFGNFLLPTQLGIRDVAFPRLNSFMFWITPAGFVLLLHILLFDKAYNLTYWLNYAELRARLRRRYQDTTSQDSDLRLGADESLLALRLATMVNPAQLRQPLLAEEAPMRRFAQAAAIQFGAFAATTPAGADYCRTPRMLAGLMETRGLISPALASAIANTVAAANFLGAPQQHAGLAPWPVFSATPLANFAQPLVAAILSDLRGAPGFGVPTVFCGNFFLTSLSGVPRPQWVTYLDGVVGPQNPGRRLNSPVVTLAPLYVLGAQETVATAYGRLRQMLHLTAHLYDRLAPRYALGSSLCYPSVARAFVAQAMADRCSVYPLPVAGVVAAPTRLSAAWLPTSEVVSTLPQALSFRAASYSAPHTARTYLRQYYHLLAQPDYLNDWRDLKFERELWRSLDDIASARRHWLLRKRYYATFFAPATLINKVSIWMPNHIIPGWAFITPYTSRLRYTALGKVDVALLVVLLASLGSVFSAVNYVITYRYIGAPILKNRKELRSFYVDALLVGSRMMIAANPALIIGILLLLSDRHLGTSVFDFSGGGDTILFQHLFWFFGHPEVYIVIIPCFGFMNSLLPYYLRKRLSGRLSLQFSMYTIAFMSFAVWGHHMYMVGLANSVRTLYSTGTVMISVPASTKILHWCVTLIQSTLSCDVGFLFLLAFMYFFVLGGLSGMFVAHLGFDVIFHDTFYVIGHFHVMFACAAMCCIFAAFYFYFSSIFGVRYSRFFAYLHFFFFVAGQLITIIPMMWLGYAGMPRRIMDYPAAFAGWHSIISSGHLLIVLSFIFFFCMLLDSIYENRAPISKTRGVSRLNTRLSFYAYEIRKLRYSRTKAQNLLKRPAARRSGDVSGIYHLGYIAESANFEYVFERDFLCPAPTLPATRLQIQWPTLSLKYPPATALRRCASDSPPVFPWLGYCELC